MCKADYVLNGKEIISPIRRPRIPETVLLQAANAIYTDFVVPRKPQADTVHPKQLDDGQ
jgi:hypothetical protein